MAILVTNAVQVARFANALYGIKLGSTTNAAVNADIANIGLSATVNAYYDYSFGSMTSAQVATVILGNLGLAGNAAAAAYVEGQLNAAGAAKGAAVLNMLNAFSNLESDATFGAAATAWNATIVSAQAYTASNTADVAATATTTQTFTLTTNLDAGPNYTGGAGDDTFNALTTTLGTGDNLVGGAGTDTLSLTGTLTAAVSLAGFTLNSIDKVNVSIADGDAANAHALTLNMANAGATTVALSGLAATTKADGLTLTNLATGSSLALNNATNVDLNATFVAAATAGTADAVGVALNSVTSTAATDGILTVGAGFETMNISTSGAAASLDDIVFGGKQINVTGDQNLTVRQQLDGSLEVIAAGTYTGRLNIVTASDTTTPDATVAGVDVTDISITGGSGNDTIDLTANAASNELNVNAGAGDDTVTIGNVLANASSTNAGDILVGGAGNDTLAGDVDLFDAGTAGFTGTTSVTGASGFETLSVNGFGAEANTVNVSNISADITAVTVASAVGAQSLTVAYGTAAAYSVNIGTAAATLAGSTLTVSHAGTGTTDALTISNTNAATGTNQIGDADTAIATTGFETVTIGTGSYSTATAQLVNTVNVGTNTLVLTGSNGLTTKATTGIITAGVINASAMTGALIQNVAAASGVTLITGGSAADTLRGDAASTINGGAGNDGIFGGTGNDALNGDAGDDTITTDTGNDNVNGGDGNDTLTFGGDLSALDTVAGGAGTDSISLTNTSLTALKALTISEANTFNTNFTSVETLIVTDALDQTSFDLGYMNTLTGVRLDAGITGAETLNGVDSGEQLELRAALSNTLTVGVNNAATGTTDALTVVFGASANTDYTDLAIANVETITINNTEATASATVRANTIGLSITQATGGAAQSVIINGNESLTVDTAIAAATINASGLTAAAATDAGLTMGVAFTATAVITGQTITGSGKVDVLRGSTGADNINAGAGNDDIHGNRGADTIDGGAGIDTYQTTNLVGASVEGAGTGTSTGVVINLGSVALSNANVLANSTQDLSGGLASVAAGQIAYVYNGSNPTNSSVVKSITNVENITLAANGKNYVVGSDVANSIVGGSGTDYINGGAGNDILAGAGGADTLVGGTGSDTFAMTGTIAGLELDVVTDFSIGAVGTGDIFRFTGANLGDGNTTLTFTTAAAASAAALSELNVFTTALANDAAVVTAIQTVTSTTPSLFVIFNTTSGNAEVWYDASANVDGGETKLVSLTGITSAASLADITGTNFVTLV